MPLPDLFFLTGNSNKAIEASRLWPGRLEVIALDLPEIQSLDLWEVLRAKGDEARRGLGRLDRPFVVEETALELDALNGFPGPLVKWMLEAVGPEGIARVALALGDPRATARCALLCVHPDGTRLEAESLTRGTLVLPPRGGHGFGWDPVFQPEGECRTYGELGAEAKDQLGHRGRAWRALGARLA